MMETILLLKKQVVHIKVNHYLAFILDSSILQNTEVYWHLVAGYFLRIINFYSREALQQISCVNSYHADRWPWLSLAVSVISSHVVRCSEGQLNILPGPACKP